MYFLIVLVYKSILTLFIHEAVNLFRIAMLGMDLLTNVFMFKASGDLTLHHVSPNGTSFVSREPLYHSLFK